MSMEFEPIREQTLPEAQRLAMEAECRRAMGEGRQPDPHAWGGVPKRPSVAQPGSLAAEDVFTAADLTPALLNNSRKFPIPGTEKHLWVFPAAPDDVKMMAAWSLQPDELKPDPADPKRRQRALSDMEIDLKVCQAILCTRQGPTRDARRCFGIEHRAALSAMLGNSTVLEICRISDELGGNEEVLGASARRFFYALLASSRTLLSACGGWEDCPTGLKDTQERLQSLGMRLLSRGSINSSLMDELREVEARLRG